MANVRIFDATLTNCSFENNSSTIDGGGILNVLIPTGGPTQSDCTFTDNSASEGGGMSNESSHVSVANCTFKDNRLRMAAGSTTFMAAARCRIARSRTTRPRSGAADSTVR